MPLIKLCRTYGKKSNDAHIGNVPPVKLSSKLQIYVIYVNYDKMLSMMKASFQPAIQSVDGIINVQYMYEPVSDCTKTSFRLIE